MGDQHQATLVAAIVRQCQSAKAAARVIAAAGAEQKKTALQAAAKQLKEDAACLLAENQKDVAAATAAGKPAAFIDRLVLTTERIDAMVDGLNSIASLPDPVGRLLAAWDRPNGLQIQRVAVPLGVLGVIYESRPNVTADAAALAIKSGNAVILRGGSDSFHTAKAILSAIHHGLTAASLPLDAVQMIDTPDRDAVTILLQQDQYIDVMIPRGGKSLVKKISEESKIPLFKHLEGICHTYLHAAADKEMALSILLNAKLRRPGICGATETLLIDEAIVDTHLPMMIEALLAQDCLIRGDAIVHRLYPETELATELDWQTEYLSKTISIKVVTNIEQAITHINHYGSQHTDAIVTADQEAATQFLQQVDSAIVMHNTSTQFADGAEFGMGAEIGIATGKLHARGPVGVEQLTTFQYRVLGRGQIRAP